MIVYKMLRSIPFHVRCIANPPDRAMSLRILLDWLHRLSIRTSIRVVEMPILMQYDPDMVDSKTNSIAHLSLSRSLLYVFDSVHSRWEQFWLQFFLTGCTQERKANRHTLTQYYHYTANCFPQIKWFFGECGKTEQRRRSVVAHLQKKKAHTQKISKVNEVKGFRISKLLF